MTYAWAMGNLIDDLRHAGESLREFQLPGPQEIRHVVGALVVALDELGAGHGISKVLADYAAAVADAAAQQPPPAPGPVAVLAAPQVASAAPELVTPPPEPVHAAGDPTAAPDPAPPAGPLPVADALPVDPESQVVDPEAQIATLQAQIAALRALAPTVTTHTNSPALAADLDPPEASS